MLTLMMMMTMTMDYDDDDDDVNNNNNYDDYFLHLLKSSYLPTQIIQLIVHITHKHTHVHVD